MVSLQGDGKMSYEPKMLIYTIIIKHVLMLAVRALCTAGTVMHSEMKWTAYCGQTLHKRNRAILKIMLASLTG